MKKILILLSICASFFNSLAQNNALNLYFEINQIESDQNYAKLDSFLNTLKVKSVNVRLVGYADFLSNNEYNLALSKNRAEHIKAHLAKRSKEPHVNVLSCTGKGEAQSVDNNNPLGEAKQRRVEMLLENASSNNNVNTRPVQIEAPPAEVKPELVAGKKLIDIQIGQSIELHGVSFVPGKHIILDASIPVLFDLLETLKQNPKVKIEIQGHVCCIEDSKEDALDYGTGERILSVNRAKAVFDFLIKNGIDRTRLKYRGFGHKHPKVSPETSPDDEQMNRRVEIMLIEK